MSIAMTLTRLLLWGLLAICAWRFAFVSTSWASGLMLAVVATVTFAEWWLNARGRGPLLSIAVLTSKPRGLSKRLIAHAVQRAWGVNVSQGDRSAAHWVVGDGPYFVSAAGRTVIVAEFGRMPEQSEKDMPRELRVRRIIEQQRGAFTVYLRSLAAGEAADAALRVVAQLAAELIDENSLALSWSRDRRLLPVTAETADQLRDDPESAFDLSNVPPTIGIAPDDPRMLAAEQEARSRWAEFVAAFRAGGEARFFSVKAPIRDGENCEFIWIEVERVEDDRVGGKLGNDPVNLPSFKLGDPVDVPLSELNDWMWADMKTGETHGAFTVKVLEAAADEQTEH